MVEYNKLYNQTKNLKVLYVEDDRNFQTETCIILDYVPRGSDMLRRHGLTRIKYYQEITSDVKVI